MKKIKVSTVKQMADVEVLFINSNLISKAIRASIAAQNILKMCEYNGGISPVIETNDEGVVTDENGKEVQMRDENGNPMFNYSSFRMDTPDVEEFHKHVVPFIQELVDAFEAE